MHFCYPGLSHHYLSYLGSHFHPCSLLSIAHYYLFIAASDALKNTSTVVQWLRLRASNEGAWIWYLVGELDPISSCCCCCSVAQSCLTLCVPKDGSSPGSSAHRIFQARRLEWGDTSYSRGSSQPRDITQVFSISCIDRQILYHCTTWEAPAHW